MDKITYAIIYSDVVVKKDIPKLPQNIKPRIRKTIEDKLRHHPFEFGKPLKYAFLNQRSMRIGKYRVIYCIKSDQEKVEILAIDHRKDVYD